MKKLMKDGDPEVASTVAMLYSSVTTGARAMVVLVRRTSSEGEQHGGGCVGLLRGVDDELGAGVAGRRWMMYSSGMMGASTTVAPVRWMAEGKPHGGRYEGGLF